MVDIFEEVDEALQKEKAEKFWHDHKDKIITGIVGLVILTAIISFTMSWNQKRNGEETARLFTAVQSNESLDEIVGDTRKGVMTLGSLLNAGKALDEDQQDLALEQYSNLIENNTSQDFKDYARFLKTKYSESTDISVLKPVIQDETSPWYWHARLQAASIEAETNQNYDQALEYLSPFESAENIPATLRQRANALTHIYQIRNNTLQAEKAEGSEG
ncbi:MAG: hypothetical protein AAF549_03875 [Pseudomonadota bacterium]